MPEAPKQADHHPFYPQPPTPRPSVLREDGIEYDYRLDITNRATLEANFREKFQGVNRDSADQRPLLKVQEAVERLQEYRTALITAAVTGKIDVRNYE